MEIARRFALIAGVMLFAAGESRAQSFTVTVTPDVDYEAPELSSPAYSPGSGPKIAVYATSTVYTIANLYQGFATLLDADGYSSQEFDQTFDPQSCSGDLTNCLYFQRLLQIDTLVMANRLNPVSAAEAELLIGWVSGTLGCPSDVRRGACCSARDGSSCRSTRSAWTIPQRSPS